MGMRLTATWTCDRCTKIENIVQGKVPDGWAMVSKLEIVLLDDNTHGIDVKLPQARDKHLLCDDCMIDYQNFLRQFLDSDADTAVTASGGLTPTDNIRVALQQQVERKTEAPVDPEADTPAASDEETVIDISDDLIDPPRS